MFVMLSCLFVMLVNLVLCHSVLPNVSWLQETAHCAQIQLTRQIVYELIGPWAV